MSMVSIAHSIEQSLFAEYSSVCSANFAPIQFPKSEQQMNGRMKKAFSIAAPQVSLSLTLCAQQSLTMFVNHFKCIKISKQNFVFFPLGLHTKAFWFQIEVQSLNSKMSHHLCGLWFFFGTSLFDCSQIEQTVRTTLVSFQGNFENFASLIHILSQNFLLHFNQKPIEAKRSQTNKHKLNAQTHRSQIVCPVGDVLWEVGGRHPY